MKKYFLFEFFFIFNLLSGSHVDIIDTTEDGGGQLGSEGVPGSVLDFLDWVGAALGCWNFNLNLLLAIDGVAWDQVLGGQDVLFALGDEDTAMSVRLDDNFGAAFGTTTTTAASSTTTSAASATTTASWRLSETSTAAS